MKWIGLIVMWAASASLGLYLAQQESLGWFELGLIVGAIALAFLVAWLFVRHARAKALADGDGDRPG